MADSGQPPPNPLPPPTEEVVKQPPPTGDVVKTAPENSLNATNPKTLSAILSYANIIKKSIHGAQVMQELYDEAVVEDPSSLPILKPTCMVDGKVSLKFKLSDKHKYLEGMQHVLVGKFSHGRPQIDSIKEFFIALKLKGDYNISLYDTKHLFIECALMEDFTRLWMRTVWFVKGSPMPMFKWTPDFSPDRESPLSPVWIHLNGLPFYLFNDEALYSIANSIGSPLRIDRTIQIGKETKEWVQKAFGKSKDNPPTLTVEDTIEVQNQYDALLGETTQDLEEAEVKVNVQEKALTTTKEDHHTVKPVNSLDYSSLGPISLLQGRVQYYSLRDNLEDIVPPYKLPSAPTSPTSRDGQWNTLEEASNSEIGDLPQSTALHNLSDSAGGDDVQLIIEKEGELPFHG
ncbi:hypothetical protein LIER_30354 [Lithospermum erythrorhizon]|uniref:DUF4283 domain-containing protein n=1 Tax=Lithospermum erythrorhizon TaxID=34254 RepID=A0AAV3RQF5_LITER